MSLSDPEQSPEDERAETIRWVHQQISVARQVAGTPGEQYLKHRGLRPPWPTSLMWSDRYHCSPNVRPRTCLIAKVTNPAGEIVAVQSTEIDLSGMKAQTDTPRMSRGPISEGTVFLGDSKASPSTLVVGEGIETVLTRCSIGPCDAHACLGALRFVKAEPHHRRVEILADTNAREPARRMARAYANLGRSVFVVTVPDSLGPKADLNDALRELGSNAVLMAIEDAERFTEEEGSPSFDLAIGSDVEIARKIIERLEDLHGPVIVCEGRMWRFDKTHWAALNDDHVVRFVHCVDSTPYPSSDGKRIEIVKLNKNRVTSIIDAALKYRGQADFFQNPPCGINCESGFIRVADDGTATLLPHARQWRQRHVVRGHWPVKIDPEVFKNSLLAKYLRDATRGDVDAEDKVRFLGEIAGCTALGYGTKLRNPKAIIAYSEEGNTGKSTFLKLLRSLPNEAAISSVPPGKFGNEYYAYRLIGKILNTADELPDRAVRTDVFKRMITGEPVPARDLYRSATDFVPIALHVFSTNVLPSFSGGVDGGVVRRLGPIEFTHVIPESDRDPDLVDHILNNEPDIFLHFAVEGARRLSEKRDFTIPSSSQELLNRWMLSVDPVRAWAAARLEVTIEEHRIMVAALYADFVSWAEEQGQKRDSLPNVIAFGKRLPKAAPGLRHHRSDGASYRNARLQQPRQKEDSRP